MSFIQNLTVSSFFKVVETEDASRGPLSGCIRLADSSRIIQRLKVIYLILFCIGFRVEIHQAQRSLFSLLTVFFTVKVKDFLWGFNLIAKF